ncbi:hypothetical protein KAR91_56540 [Candidatus Pacearchaeota archaeon]|nr:hypothetical protein [Candidatus Pacearchaeota archaeon]
MRTVYGSSDCVYLDHEGIEHQTPKAILFKIHGEMKWIPKFAIVDEGDGVVAIKKRWADKNGIRGDW